MVLEMKGQRKKQSAFINIFLSIVGKSRLKPEQMSIF